MGNMQILIINEQLTIEVVQKQFNKVFPFLKIEFFKEKHQKGIGTEKKNMYVNRNEYLFVIAHQDKCGQIQLEGNQTVEQLEEIFETNFGLHVQIFRKSGKIWLETSTTDGWTLNQQNEEGKLLEEELKIEKENIDDHDIW